MATKAKTKAKTKTRIVTMPVTGTAAAALRTKKVSLLEVYKDKSKQYRWRKIASNGRITCVSGEAFNRRRYAAISARREFPDERARLIHVIHV